MPLRTLLAKSGNGAAHRRHSSIIEDGPTSGDDTTTSGRGRADSMKRLSLGFPHAGQETFNPFPSPEEDRTVSRQSSMQPDGSPVEQPGQPKSGSTLGATSSTRTESQLDLSPNAGVEGLLLPRPQRFSLLGFRHASDSQLSMRFRKEDPTTSTDNAPPKIITTAPTMHEFDEMSRKRSRRKLFPRAPSPFRKSQVAKTALPESPEDVAGERAIAENGKPTTSRVGMLQEKTSFERLPRPNTHSGPSAPPAYGDESSSSLAIPVTRLSNSSHSDDSSGDHHVYAKTTTTHTISTTTTFFKLRRRKKDKGPLFPLPEKFATPASGRTSTSYTPQESIHGRKSMSPSRRSNAGVRFETEPSRPGSIDPSPTQSAVALTNAPFGALGPTMVRQDSAWSTHSGQSTPSVALAPPRTGGRGRSSTMSSLGKSAEKLLDAVPQPGSARTSTSTSGRRSFGDLLGLPHRLRQNSAPPTRYGAAASSPGTPGSKSNSLQISRDPERERVYPRREDGDTPATYLEKLEAAVPRGAMATILCKNADDFSKTCLRKYMRGFAYFGDSIDMAIRKMLMEVELPKETQQIDRLLAGFSDRYYECNPGIFSSTDEAAFVAFSILLLHSDAHNKNNKRKMQRHDYIKNTQQGPVQISSDILDCFYDNVCYTPFIHFEDEVAINSRRLAAPRPKKSLIKTKSLESLRGPVDPYTLILDNKLDVLRPPLKDVMDTEDCYSSTGTAGPLDTYEVHRAFINSAVLQIVSARSRPDAFLSQATISNPGEAQAGLVSIKVAKVGLLWRKDTKKKKAKRTWQEWGAILTDSKLYFFKDVGWVKKLISQHDGQSRSAQKQGGLIFKPPLSSFEPDALMSMDDAVALMDSSYKKHKNAFVFIKHGGFEEVFLANSESEMNDWMGKLNYAATFRTAGVRMRGILGTNYEGRHLLRKNSDFSTRSGETPQKEIPRKVETQMSWEIMFYRRQLVHEKISDFDEKIAAAQKELDNLLRNARHLLILLPVQQKTREQVVLAAGRMSAKLKWTRVELWRTRTHRDVLVKDLEQEGATAFPVPRASTTSTPQKTTPSKAATPILGRTITDTSQMTMSPISATSSRPSNLIERLKTSENESTRTDPSTIDLSASGSPPPTADTVLTIHDSSHDSHSLNHQASITSSHHSRDQDQSVRRTDESDEPVLREAGPVPVDGNGLKDKRPGTSESERDQVGTVPALNDGAKSSHIRRSLHRSLREAALRDGHHHHSPSIHRHRKGRDSGSSVTGTEDGGKSMHSEAEELRRGTGSFMLHGKKASVITMSSEWQSLSTEERLRLRNAGQDDEARDKPSDVHDDDDDTASHVSKHTDDDHYGSLNSSRKPSIATTAGEHFVDAETGVDEEEEDDDDDDDEMEHT